MLAFKTYTRIAMLIATVFCAAPAWADYTYICKDVDHKSYTLHVDDAETVLTWRGREYDITVVEGCRYTWHANPKGGEGPSFDLCTATKGYADIIYADGSSVPCRMKGRHD